MPEKQPKSSDETYEELRNPGDEDDGLAEGPTPALTKGGRPEADKVAHQEEEDATIGQRREVAAQVRGGSPAHGLEPDFAVARDARTVDEVADVQAKSLEELAARRDEEQAAAEAEAEPAKPAKRPRKPAKKGRRR